ncbi:hypothetical protein [Lysobacter sp. Root604]|uniref:hypothetical protein n=1 Tax=Lysobacter sp. Root604 TaxID=1736568 RepID=UPI0006F97289|nr:hypothetical protein [Lysobacter sp. Root604]KRA15337.1 hypothetical protein ASD69_17840 [Lysobacter sp. Root604]
MREYPDVPLPEHFHWRQCERKALTWFLMYGPCEVATYGRDGIYWRVRVGTLWADSVQREAVAESVSEARYWCAKWAIREAKQIAVTRPTALYEWGPMYRHPMGAMPGSEPSVSSWTPDQESARRRGSKRRRNSLI